MDEIIKMLKKEIIGVLPTDTLYGLVGRALSKKAVARIYKLKERDSKKPFIILIGSIKNLKLFDIKVDGNTKKILQKYWPACNASHINAGKPGKVSIILPCNNKKFSYLHRGIRTLAFRIPGKKNLLDLLEKTGPLVAPSANPEGKNPALTIKEAKAYFGEKVDFYVDEGKLESLPSTLIKIKNGKIEVLRKGVVYPIE